MFKSVTATILFFIAFVISLTSAIVINPKITVPNSSTKWRAGNTYVVKWKTSYNDGNQDVAIPDEYKGTIKLGYLEKNDPYNEHLLWDDLASGFKLNAGSQSITLPSDLETKRSYIIVLMGNSGNASPKFTIQAAR